VNTFNAAVDQGTPFDKTKKDGRAARGIRPEKSNWANTLDTPPYHAYTVTGGVTFTFGGVKTNTESEVDLTEDQVNPRAVRRGEIQATSSTTTTLAVAR
jgi:tricarballylate dehydrogenase